MGKKALILEIPTKDRGTLKYFTSKTYMEKFLHGLIPVIYFNPRSDFEHGRKKGNS